jgi:hypothetical protein
MRRLRIGWIVGALAMALVVAAIGSTLAGAQGDDTRRGTDPLSPDEVQAAIDDSGAPPEGGAESLGTNGLPERLVLLVERHIEDKDADENLRRADVYEYDYDGDTLTRSVVDLADGEVDEVVSDQGTQLPLVEVEEQRALDLLFADQEFADRLAEEFQAATGRALGDPDADLDVQPIIFRADALPLAAQSAAADCGIARCAQFLIQTTDHVLIRLLPLVDLSAAEVLAVDGAPS